MRRWVRLGLLFLVALSLSGLPLSGADPLTLLAPEPLTGSYDDEANTLDLSWTAPTGYGTHAGDKFRVYVNDTFYDETTTATYTDDLSLWHTGLRAYTVTMIFDGQESLHTQPYTLTRWTTTGTDGSCTIATIAITPYPQFVWPVVHQECIPDP